MKWEKKIREKIKLPHRVMPKTFYEQLSLADDTFRLEIHEDEDTPGVFYPYFVSMSGPLRLFLAGTNKEVVKQQALEHLEDKFRQALAELKELRENTETEK